MQVCLPALQSVDTEVGAFGRSWRGVLFGAGLVAVHNNEALASPSVSVGRRARTRIRTSALEYQTACNVKLQSTELLATAAQVLLVL